MQILNCLQTANSLIDTANYLRGNYGAIHISINGLSMKRFPVSTFCCWTIYGQIGQMGSDKMDRNRFSMSELACYLHLPGSGHLSELETSRPSGDRAH
jgi:hypothetical protein